ncbi:MAG: RHS repeat-associated core domain-containing protein [Phycisphaerales bacterium]
MRKTIQRPDRRKCPSFNREGPSAPHPLWPKTTVTGSGHLRFRYKRSCEYGDEFTLFIDGSYRFGCNGAIDNSWTESSAWYITGSGTHTIRWRYSKNGSGSAGEDCVWVDYVRWSGTMPDAGPWGQIEYVYDCSGRRIEKKVDGTTELKFLYDGDHIIAEYDANDTLLRKYVHGPCIDEPICMIESSGTYAGTQYYHYDALGSVVALTDPNGDVVQLYEYSVYGQVAASDANHPNRFMFTGREFDKDTGLYYYRARYYHPEIGRFLQTDPVDYGAGMNLYWYCTNNPLNMRDSFGSSPSDSNTPTPCDCSAEEEAVEEAEEAVNAAREAYLATVKALKDAGDNWKKLTEIAGRAWEVVEMRERALKRAVGALAVATAVATTTCAKVPITRTAEAIQKCALAIVAATYAAGALQDAVVALRHAQDDYAAKAKAARAAFQAVLAAARMRDAAYAAYQDAQGKLLIAEAALLACHLRCNAEAE